MLGRKNTKIGPHHFGVSMSLIKSIEGQTINRCITWRSKYHSNFFS